MGELPSRDEIAERLYDVSNRIMRKKFWPGWTPRPLHEDPAAFETHYAYADEMLAMMRSATDEAVATPLPSPAQEGK